MLRDTLRASVAQIGTALREPEEFALAWERDSAYQPFVWLALAGTAVMGTTFYGMTMGIGSGAAVIGYKAVWLTVAAGLAWAIPLPALYVLNSLAGSRLRASTTLLAALVTTSWGGLALVASVPINWFFSVAIPAQAPRLYSQGVAETIVLGVNLLVYSGVGISMCDVFRRVMYSLDPSATRNPLWFLGLVGVIGAQLFYLFGLFTF